MSTQSMVVVYPVYDQIFDTNGSRTSRRFVALGLVTKPKGPFKKVSKPFLNGLGGKIERDESSFSAACREIHEECGITPEASELTWAATVNVLRGNTRVRLFVYLWKLPTKVTLSPAGEHPEFDSFHWQEVGGSYAIGEDSNQYHLDIGTHFPKADILEPDYHWLTTVLLFEKHLLRKRVYVRVTDDFKLVRNMGETSSVLRYDHKENPSR